MNIYKLSLSPYSSHGRILQMIPARPGRVLDIGCNEGYLGKLIKRKRADVVFGIEGDKDAAGKAKKTLDKVITADLNDVSALKAIKFDSDFDHIICADVLEHLVDPKTTLMQIKRWLKKDGFLIVSLPNIAFFMNRFKILLGNAATTDGGIMDRTHLHFYNRQSAVDLIESADFEIVELDHSRLGRLGWFPFAPNFFGLQTIIKARKH